jgi:hypothetical protein
VAQSAKDDVGCDVNPLHLEEDGTSPISTIVWEKFKPIEFIDGIIREIATAPKSFYHHHGWIERRS